MTMHVKGEGLKFPDGTEQTTAGVGGTGGGTGGSGVYTKDETDTLLDTKANVGVSYTKAEVDVKVDTKADIGDSYTKAEDETRLATKADVAETYTKSEVEALIGAISVIPAGVISIWSGATATVPSGWKLCDGSGGTPDLRNRFVMGAVAGSSSVGLTGGSKDAVAISHNHTGSTNSTGNHYHLQGEPSTGGGSFHGMQNHGGGDLKDRASLVAGLINHQAYITNTTGAHAHTFTTSTNGVAGTDKNLPPYYTLAYIMKL